MYQEYAEYCGNLSENSSYSKRPRRKTRDKNIMDFLDYVRAVIDGHYEGTNPLDRNKVLSLLSKLTDISKILDCSNNSKISAQIETLSQSLNDINISEDIKLVRDLGKEEYKTCSVVKYDSKEISEFDLNLLTNINFATPQNPNVGVDETPKKHKRKMLQDSGTPNKIVVLNNYKITKNKVNSLKLKSNESVVADECFTKSSNFLLTPISIDDKAKDDDVLSSCSTNFGDIGRNDFKNEERLVEKYSTSKESEKENGHRKDHQQFQTENILSATSGDKKIVDTYFETDSLFKNSECDMLKFTNTDKMVLISETNESESEFRNRNEFTGTNKKSETKTPLKFSDVNILNFTETDKTLLFSETNKSLPSSNGDMLFSDRNKKALQFSSVNIGGSKLENNNLVGFSKRKNESKKKNNSFKNKDKKIYKPTEHCQLVMKVDETNKLITKMDSTKKLCYTIVKDTNATYRDNPKEDNRIKCHFDSPKDNVIRRNHLGSSKEYNTSNFYNTEDSQLHNNKASNDHFDVSKNDNAIPTSHHTQLHNNKETSDHFDSSKDDAMQTNEDCQLHKTKIPEKMDAIVNALQDTDKFNENFVEVLPDIVKMIEDLKNNLLSSILSLPTPHVPSTTIAEKVDNTNPFFFDPSKESAVSLHETDKTEKVGIENDERSIMLEYLLENCSIEDGNEVIDIPDWREL